MQPGFEEHVRIKILNAGFQYFDSNTRYFFL